MEAALTLGLWPMARSGPPGMARNRKKLTATIRAIVIAACTSLRSR